MSEPRFLYGEIEAVAGQEQTVAQLIADYGDRVRTEPGNRRFDAFTLDGQPARVFVYEEYESEEAFQAHRTAAYCDRFNEQLAPLAVGGGSRLTWLVPIT